MSYINNEDKPKYQKSKYINAELAQKYVYNTKQWQNLRTYKLRNNPLCEECLRNDRSTLATQVHHIYSFWSATSIEQMKHLGFDYTNLESLCTECHENKHK